MRKLAVNLLAIAWFVLVLGLTTHYLANGNRIVYYVVTIALLVIPTEIVKRLLKNRKKAIK